MSINQMTPSQEITYIRTRLDDLEKRAYPRIKPSPNIGFDRDNPEPKYKPGDRVKIRKALRWEYGCRPKDRTVTLTHERAGGFGWSDGEKDGFIEYAGIECLAPKLEPKVDVEGPGAMVWRDHERGKCPLDKGRLYIVQSKNGRFYLADSSNLFLRWGEKDVSYNVAKYAIIDPPPGYGGEE